MAKSENPERRDSIEKVLDEFDASKDKLDAFCIRTKSLIEDCLQEAQLRFQSIQSRVKRRDKLRDKYLNPKKDYKQLDDITDQAALRVIVYYEDEIDRAAELIREEFKILPEFSVDKRRTDPDRFGYYAMNFVCTHADKRKADVQFKKYADLRFEIQITSVLNHAWSEIEHEWYDLQDAYPSEIKRRFSRLAALLEIAESEFLSLRNQKTNYKRSVDIRVQADVPEIAIDSVSMSTFIAIEPVVADLDKRIAAIVGVTPIPAQLGGIELRAKISNLAGFKSLEDLRRALMKYSDALIDYVTRASPLWEKPGPSSIQQGVSIYQLGMMLIGARGPEQVLAALKDLGFVNANVPWVDQQAVIAAEVLSKFKGS